VTPAPVAAPGVDASALPLSLAGLADTFVFTAIYTQTSDGGGDDEIYGDNGHDILMGQQGDDKIYGGNGDDDLIGGHNVRGGHDGDDRLDGEADNDVIAGDNARILRRGDTRSPRMRILAGTLIYDSGDIPQVTGDSKLNPLALPLGVEERDVVLFDHSFDPLPGTYGDDKIAGGANHDVLFGQLGDDVIQGDGSIALNASSDDAGASRVTVSDGLQLLVTPSDEASTDGDDYIEGNGGDDVIFGGLGQDDIVGGSSTLFGLASPDLRPDGADIIFGGSGERIDRNHAVTNDNRDTIVLNQAHARDSDAIAGDNANIYRLVGSGAGTPAFLWFAYDLTTPPYEDRGSLRIVPRAVVLIDYTPGGPDFVPASEVEDIGANDEIHGESGDDFIYGMKGDDVLFGDSQDDDLIGGYGNDWISGGTGDDGILGDDGRIYTSRNGTPEPLYGILAVPAGQTLDQAISTPGKIQQAVVNVSGELKKTVNLTPFSLFFYV
jgi:Ca2+-binding RTX toxin-like protein